MRRCSERICSRQQKERYEESVGRSIHFSADFHLMMCMVYSLKGLSFGVRRSEGLACKGTSLGMYHQTIINNQYTETQNK